MKFKSLLLIVVALGVTACSSLDNVTNHSATLPKTLDGKGLVVGRISGFRRLGFLTGSDPWIKIAVDRHTPEGGLFDTYVIFARQPGEHTLNSFYSSMPGGSSYYGGVTVQTTSVRTAPMNRKFVVKENEITNLGLMVFVTDPHNPEKFVTLLIDNTAEMEDYLHKKYPALTAGRKMSLAEGKYLGNDKLPAIRRAIAPEVALATKRQGCR